MSLILTISVATCTSSVFVHLEKYGLRNSGFAVCFLFLILKIKFILFLSPFPTFYDFYQQKNYFFVMSLEKLD